MGFNWQQPDWPDFTFNLDEVEPLLYEYAEKIGRVAGTLKNLGDSSKSRAMLDLMVAEAVKSSAIEGEFLSRKEVMSSIRNNLGLGKPTLVKDHRAAGIGELMVAVRKNFTAELTDNMLFDWHTMVMKGTGGVEVGKWRTHAEPMQVISGALGKEKVHFEAPPSDVVPTEMQRFLKWFNDSSPAKAGGIQKPLLRAAIAHLWFESIHPFEDGNGRLGRAISEKALSEHAGRPVVLSLSTVIEAERKRYYKALQRAQQTNEITGWLMYFSQTAVKAQKNAEAMIDFSLKKAHFFDRWQSELNDRQLKVVRRMLKEGPAGFEGGMNASKYQGITKASKATATRDLQDLVSKKIFVAKGGGRSTSYVLRLN